MSAATKQPIAPVDCYFARAPGSVGYHLVSRSLGALRETARCGQQPPVAGWLTLATILGRGQLVCERCAKAVAR